MKIGEFKDYALRFFTEEHLWKIGESDTFSINENLYKIERVENGFDLLKNNMFIKNFPTGGKLFGYLLNKFSIHY